jgi:hypothetical protein
LGTLNPTNSITTDRSIYTRQHLPIVAQLFSLQHTHVRHTNRAHSAYPSSFRRRGLHGVCPATGLIAIAVGGQRCLPLLAIASMPKPEEGKHNVQQNIPNRPRDLTEVSRAVLRSEQAKRWTKKYRTEIAASSSSLLSTFSAVRTPLPSGQTWNLGVLIASSILSIRSRPDCKRMPAPQIPVDHR